MNGFRRLNGIYSFCVQKIISSMEMSSSQDLARLLERCSNGSTDNMKKLLSFYERLVAGYEKKIEEQKTIIDKLYVVSGEYLNNPKPKNNQIIHTQKAIRNAERFEEKGQKFEAELERLKRVLEKMVTQDPSGATDELDQIYEELGDYENVHSKLHQLFSGLNPNSFPQEGESETFLQNKFRDLSFHVVRRIAQICAKDVKQEEKETQTYKQMTDEYYMEMKAEQQDEMIKEQLHKIDDLEARMKLKNEKLSLFSKENRELNEKVKKLQKEIEELNIENTSLQERVEKFRHTAEVAEKKYKSEHKKNVEAQEQVDIARGKARNAEIRAEQLKAVAATFTPKSYERNTQESGESSVESPSHAEKKFLFSPKGSDGGGGWNARDSSEKPRSSRSKYLKVRGDDEEEETKSWKSSFRKERNSGQEEQGSPFGAAERGEFETAEKSRKLQEIEKAVLSKGQEAGETQKIPGGDAPSIVTYTLDPGLQKQMAEMEKLKQTLNARKSIGEHSSVGNLSTQGPSQTETANMNDTKRSRLPTENSVGQETLGQRSSSIDKQESGLERALLKLNEQRDGTRKISEEGGRRGVKELEMVSRKFRKSQFKSKFASQAKSQRVLEEEEKDELLIEEIEEGDDASTSYQGVRESRQKTLRSRGMRYEAASQELDSGGENEAEGEEEKQEKVKTTHPESACYSSELELNERKEEAELSGIRVDEAERTPRTPRVSNLLLQIGGPESQDEVQHAQEKVDKEKEECVQTELTLPIMAYMTSQLPRDVYKECIRAPMSREEEKRVEKILTMQREKQTMFQKYGYRIKGGSIATEQPMLSQTFSSKFQPGVHGSPPRDAPSCLVVKKNSDEYRKRNQQLLRVQRGGSGDYYRTR